LCVCVCVCECVCDDESAVQANNHALKSGTLKGECCKRGKKDIVKKTSRGRHKLVKQHLTASQKFTSLKARCVIHSLNVNDCWNIFPSLCVAVKCTILSSFP